MQRQTYRYHHDKISIRRRSGTCGVQRTNLVSTPVFQQTGLICTLSLRQDTNRNGEVAMNLLKRRCVGFGRQVLLNGAFVGMAALFVVGKTALNVLVGARPATAARSGLMGLAMYVLGAFVIHLLSEERAIHNNDGGVASRGSTNVYLALALFSLIGVVLTWTALHSIGSIGSGVPLWSGIRAAWEEWVRGLTASSPHFEGTGLIGFPNLLLYVALPALVYVASRRSLPNVGGLKPAIPSMPFVILYIVAFCVVRGISTTSLLTLFFVMLWPALGEEFLYRGILQNTLTDFFGNAVTGIVTTSFLFAASHIPAYVIAGSGPVVLRWSALLPVLLTSFFWGYGYHRTGVLWPWVFIHAASNLVGF
jgi:membrane protease YdiL (CAAX protease family)